MTQQELYQHLADRTGEDIETLESYGFELFEPDRKEQKRQRRLKQWQQQRRDRHLARIACQVPSDQHCMVDRGMLREK